MNPTYVSRKVAAEHGLDAADTQDNGTGLWRPLQHTDSIRLFALSRDPSGLLRFILSEHRLSEHPTYFAVSYVWGKLGNVGIIETQNGHRALRRNLFAILHNLQTRISLGELEQSTLFWVDALCINQESLDEKSQQVQQIGDTFEQAKKVLVWLGTHQDGNESCLKNLDLSRLHTHEYWTRVWIIQEYIKANEIILFDEVTWILGLELERCLMQINTPKGLLQTLERGNAFTNIGFEKRLMDRIIHKRFRERKFVLGIDGASETREDSGCSVVAQFRDQSCTDLRDKVYALRSLSTILRDNLPVDYTTSLGDLFWATIDVCRSGWPMSLHQVYQVFDALKLDIDHLIPEQLSRMFGCQHQELATYLPDGFMEFALEHSRVLRRRSALDNMLGPYKSQSSLKAGDVMRGATAGETFTSQHTTYRVLVGKAEDMDWIVHPKSFTLAFIFHRRPDSDQSGNGISYLLHGLATESNISHDFEVLARLNALRGGIMGFLPYSVYETEDSCLSCTAVDLIAFQVLEQTLFHGFVSECFSLKDWAEVLLHARKIVNLDRIMDFGTL